MGASHQFSIKHFISQDAAVKTGWKISCLISVYRFACAAGATEWMVFEKNMGTHLSIDETALSCDELYTIVTNKSEKVQKGAIVAVIKGTQAGKVTATMWR
jgi:hypothetical protein